MTYLIIFNGRHGIHRERISTPDWLDFIDRLNRLVMAYGEPPDLIYLEDVRK